MLIHATSPIQEPNFFWRPPWSPSFFVQVVPVSFLKGIHGGIEVNGVQLQCGSFRPFQDLDWSIVKWWFFNGGRSGSLKNDHGHWYGCLYIYNIICRIINLILYMYNFLSWISTLRPTSLACTCFWHPLNGIECQHIISHAPVPTWWMLAPGLFNALVNLHRASHKASHKSFRGPGLMAPS